jgi:hypothetical protein
MVEQPEGVVGHVIERVVGISRDSHHGPEHLGLPPAPDQGGAPHVAVVETHHAEPALDEQAAELLVPGDHLRPEPHHEQERWVLRVAERLVADLDVADPGELLGHDGRG